MHPRPQKPHRFLSKTCAYLPVVGNGGEVQCETEAVDFLKTK